jgi:exosortase/archaeosortase family protein
MIGAKHKSSSKCCSPAVSLNVDLNVRGKRMNDNRQSQRVRRFARASDGRTSLPVGWTIARFCLLFVLGNVALGLLTFTPAAGRYLHEPVARCFAYFSKLILSAFGKASVSGANLQYNGFVVQIVEACDGVLPAMIYLSAVLAFPSRWLDKGWGILIGLPAIFLVNLTRLVTLMLVGAAWPGVFEQVHIYVWQGLVIALAMAIWVFWAERFVRTRSGARS